MISDQVSFGRNLRELRNRKGLTQEELGERIGVSSNAIGQFERGKISPNYATILNIINVLDIDANLLFSREAVEYPDEAKWIADSLCKLSEEEKKTVGIFLEDIAKVILSPDRADGREDENSDY